MNLRSPQETALTSGDLPSNINLSERPVTPKGALTFRPTRSGAVGARRYVEMRCHGRASPHLRNCQTGLNNPCNALHPRRSGSRLAEKMTGEARVFRKILVETAARSRPAFSARCGGMGVASAASCESEGRRLRQTQWLDAERRRHRRGDARRELHAPRETPSSPRRAPRREAIHPG